ncbi:hypothetical protein K435DRAFT_848906 [Dendrothele bispora CBS 962.96]|uniref:Uncharacterized protein n=1 Tax=Dendrothele bispora (strain CBS 962.96) TaxID=1314807 RepID=A0A4S8MUE1_DENBC|nr:hypothetical protein K435DRAFT_848906 [Dendrothele bispora CBS 962.96]
MLQLMNAAYGTNPMGWIFFVSLRTKTLISLSILSGDVIHMKKVAPIWMASDDSKHKPADDPDTCLPNQPPVTFKRWIDSETGRDTGAAHMYGKLEPIHIDDPEWEDQQGEPGLSWFYKCEVLQQFFPVPVGYKAVIMDENSDF